MAEQSTDQRIAQLKAALNGRTDAEGNARKGYTKNVVALRAEIARLTAQAKPA
jgi:uncharacterized small protein (DUF1192 family)